MDLTSLNEALATRYTIDREIGRGGMATVYLARDLRHERLVAVKVLNPELGAVLGVERFLSEIRVTANLQHPNLLPLFDSGAADGLLYYVMPYVDGESLRHRLDREKQLPIDEAVRIAVAIAGALDYAHANKVIHRDLKPENILLQHGEPVVADFGIALAVSNAGGGRITQTGLSLGTPQYMSPEQATGDRVIDGRSDIYSLAAVLYEMLSGEAPHTGSTGQAIIARLMTETPRPLNVVRRNVPANVEFAVHRALEKLPADRWATAREFADALRGTRGVEIMRPAASKSRASIVAAVSTTVAVAAVAAAIVIARREPPANDVTLRFPLVTSDSERFTPTTPAIPFSVSPDNVHIVYVGGNPGATRLYVRGLSDLSTRVLPGTDRPLSPTYSPDGKWIAFTASDRVEKVPVDGGAPLLITPLNGAAHAGMAWADPDTIIASIGGTLSALPVNGGPPVVLSRPDTSRAETLQWGPRVLTPRYIAYTSVGTGGIATSRIGVLDRRTGKTTITDHRVTTVLGIIDGRVIWVMTTGAVMAAILQGDGTLVSPRLLMEDVLVRPGGAAKAGMSPNGTLVYQRGISSSQLLIVDAHGGAVPIDGLPRAYAHPRLSPDGSRIAVSIARSGGADIWVIDVRGRTFRRLTSAAGFDDVPVWTRDGKRILYRSTAAAGTTLELIPADGGGPHTTIRTGISDPYGAEITSDGKWVVLRTGDLKPEYYRDIFYTAVNGDGVLHEIARTRASEFSPTLSTDDRWVAYASDESGRIETYVRPFPGPGERVQITTNGGTEPRWSHDGRALFYRQGRAMKIVALTPGTTMVVGATTTLFEGNYLADPGVSNYDVAADGKQFIMLQSIDRQAETIVVYGWANELRKAWR